MPNSLTPDDLMPAYITPTFRMTPRMVEVANIYGADFLKVEACMDHREIPLAEFATKNRIDLDVPWPTDLAPASGAPDSMQPEIALALRLIPALATLPLCHTLEIGIRLEDQDSGNLEEWDEAADDRDDADGIQTARYLSMELQGEPVGMPNGFGDDIHDNAATELHVVAHRIICTCVNCGHRPAKIQVATETLAASLRPLLGNLGAKIVVEDQMDG